MCVLTPELIYTDLLPDLSSVLFKWTGVYLCLLSHAYNIVRESRDVPSISSEGHIFFI